MNIFLVPVLFAFMEFHEVFFLSTPTLYFARYGNLFPTFSMLECRLMLKRTGLKITETFYWSIICLL